MCQCQSGSDFRRLAETILIYPHNLAADLGLYIFQRAPHVGRSQEQNPEEIMNRLNRRVLILVVAR